MICREYKKINELFNQVNDVAVEMCRGKMCRGGVGSGWMGPGIAAGTGGDLLETRDGVFLCINVLIFISVGIKQVPPCLGWGGDFDSAKMRGRWLREEMEHPWVCSTPGH